MNNDQGSELNEYMVAKSSLMNRDNTDITGYIDQRINDLTRPGGLNYYNTNQARGFTTTVSMAGQGGAFDNIQNAINYVQNRGGGKILLQSGTYTINSGITISTGGLEISGEDRETTFVKVADATNGGLSVFDINADNVRLSSFTIDGNKANQASGTQYLIDFNFNGVGLVVENLTLNSQYGTNGASIYGGGDQVLIQNCAFGTGDGWAVDGVEHSMVSNCIAQSCGRGFNAGINTTVTGCRVYTTTRGSAAYGYTSNAPGAKFLGCYGSACADYTYFTGLNNHNISVIGCESRASGSAGIYLTDFHSVVTGNILRNENQYYMYLGTDANENIIKGNIIRVDTESSKDAIYLNNSYNNVISGNVIDLISTGTFADNTYSAIYLTGTSNRNIISNNRIDASVGTFNFAYGYREAGTVDDRNVIIGNIITGAGTAIGTQGANSVITGNITA